eukprot:CAMPEP_0194159826 /NCGR_PEP_ID=MMETSP0152-20130528/78049_1 /TAXON_ID=1049557 /ORGANISM="Thalassiothrix antarctica, Strain L6-D1" /LENGTH=538 /DNA_ID=CAMNT_0038869443 /DNA_START=362 /DNA_END=1975 /DNA_ORIENTATION=-
MKREMYCEQLCVSDVSADKKKGKKSLLERAIRKDYHNNWIVDNLSSASKIEDEYTVTTRYWQGFPIGYVDPEDDMEYVYNHVNIEIMYNTVVEDNNNKKKKKRRRRKKKNEEEDEEEEQQSQQKHRIVRFTVEPLSIQHKFEAENEDDEKILPLGPYRIPMRNAIASCRDRMQHTNYDMIAARGTPQLASGKVLFTYDVTWKENPEVPWSKRWDIYLSMDGTIPKKVHWFSVVNSLILDVVLSIMIACILVRSLRRDFARYNSIDEEAEDFGWKLVHADVFRPPSTFPTLFAVCCGTGAQLCAVSFFVILFSCTGFLSPANRGSLVTAELLLYVMTGSVAGYVSARLHKTFDSHFGYIRTTTMAALGFPGICLASFLLLDLLALGYGSTGAVPFATIVQLLLLWLGISIPLVFFGAYFGYAHNKLHFPTVTSSSKSRPVPPQPWFLAAPVALLVGGILPFGSIMVELYFILSSVWMDQYYHVYGILFWVYLILILTCAEIAVLYNYFALCRENYRWWWRSFLTSGGAIALYVFGYAVW